MAPGEQHLEEFRFAAEAEGVRLTGWIDTSLPSALATSGAGHAGGLCESATTLVDASPSVARFTDQTWFFSRAACASGAADGGLDTDGFGPNCLRMGH